MKTTRVFAICIALSLLLVSALSGCSSKPTAQNPPNEPITVEPSPVEPEPTPEATEPNPATEELAEPTPISTPNTLLYQGHASLRITTPEGKVIYIDPFGGDGYDVPGDLTLVTHFHYDHIGTTLIKTKNSDHEKITPAEVIVDGKHKTFTLDYVTVEAVQAYNKNHDVNECVGYVLTLTNGISLYVAGDTGPTDQMAELAEYGLDYAFFPCDGYFTMDTDEAANCAALIKAKHNIPYHLMDPVDHIIFSREVAEKFEAEGRLILEPGEEITLE